MVVDQREGLTAPVLRTSGPITAGPKLALITTPTFVRFPTTERTCRM